MQEDSRSGDERTRHPRRDPNTHLRNRRRLCMRLIVGGGSVHVWAQVSGGRDELVAAGAHPSLTHHGHPSVTGDAQPSLTRHAESSRLARESIHAAAAALTVELPQLTARERQSE